MIGYRGLQFRTSLEAPFRTGSYHMIMLLQIRLREICGFVLQLLPIVIKHQEEAEFFNIYSIRRELL